MFNLFKLTQKVNASHTFPTHKHKQTPNIDQKVDGCTQTIWINLYQFFILKWLSSWKLGIIICKIKQCSKIFIFQLKNIFETTSHHSANVECFKSYHRNYKSYNCKHSQAIIVLCAALCVLVSKERNIEKRIGVCAATWHTNTLTHPTHREKRPTLFQPSQAGRAVELQTKSRHIGWNLISRKTV